MVNLNIAIAGAAGEGVQTIGDVFAETIMAHGYAIFAWQEFESRIRGGQNSYWIQISQEPHNAPHMSADVLLALNKGAVNKYEPQIKEGGILVAQQSSRQTMITIPFSEIAQKELGNKIYTNTIAIGALVAAIGMELAVLHQVLAQKFHHKGDNVVAENRIAAEKGYELAQEGCKDICPWSLPLRNDRFALIAGKEALALAAVQAGCRYMAAYPMSPATDIITILAQHEKELEVFTEQAEDEIAAANMAIGASFGGARAMTATSGGGFALMVEALSLAGMVETPLVVVLAQRPGPATGLPTRTAQGDLWFDVNAVLGEFPKLVVAPSNIEEIFEKTIRAYDLADKYQLPVILLTDQFLLDSRFSVNEIDLTQRVPAFYLADPPQTEDYQRYQITDSGISPRLYPGQSAHLVTADSDEHDAGGHITEDLAGAALEMMNKRLAKSRGLKAEIAPPEEIATDRAETIMVGWGSSRQAILEALDHFNADGLHVGMIHFTELWPLPEYNFPQGKRYWSVENNATSQLARLLRSEYGLTFTGTINRYDGLPLTGNYVRRCFNG
mgnify:CR=1 FL=1